MDGCTGQNCWAHVDWHCEHAGLVRVFDGEQKYGDPFCYALPFVVRKRFPMPVEGGKLGLIEFVGVMKVMKPCQYRAMREAIRAEHYGILSTRSRGGQMRTIELGTRGN